MGNDYQTWQQSVKVWMRPGFWSAAAGRHALRHVPARRVAPATPP